MIRGFKQVLPPILVAGAVVALAFLGAGLAGVALVLRQLPQASPLLPVDLLRIPMFALSIGTSVCSFTAQMLAYVSIPFYFQDVLGRDAVATGLLITPWRPLCRLPLTIPGFGITARRRKPCR